MTYLLRSAFKEYAKNVRDWPIKYETAIDIKKLSLNNSSGI